MRKPEAITCVKYYDFPSKVPGVEEVIEHDNGFVYITRIKKVDYTLNSITGAFIGLEVTYEGVFIEKQ